MGKGDDDFNGFRAILNGLWIVVLFYGGIYLLLKWLKVF
jgi:hypothetical protein